MSVERKTPKAPMMRELRIALLNAGYSSFAQWRQKYPQYSSSTCQVVSNGRSDGLRDGSLAREIIQLLYQDTGFYTPETSWVLTAQPFDPQKKRRKYKHNRRRVHKKEAAAA